jgi:hypothetical protein
MIKKKVRKERCLRCRKVYTWDGYYFCPKCQWELTNNEKDFRKKFKKELKHESKR